MGVTEQILEKTEMDNGWDIEVYGWMSNKQKERWKLIKQKIIRLT